MAVELAEKLGTEILSADSRQFYKEMRIGTARPSELELARVTHHFIGHISVAEEYNAGRYEMDAMAVLKDLFSRNQHAVMVGGSGLYINAVCHGLDDLPDTDPETRRRLRLELEENGLERLKQQLLEWDPAYYRQVDLNNPSRVLRALEVCIVSGRPYSSFRKKRKTTREFNIVKIGVSMPRNILYERINERVDRMMEDGLLNEAARLVPYRHLNALNTVGYKELFEYLDGYCPLSEAVMNIKTNTRRYAKRQLTWFRKDTEIHWL